MNPAYPSDKPRRNNTAASRTVKASMVLFILLLAITMAVSLIVFENLNESASRNLVSSYSSEAAAKFYSFLYPELILAQKASRSNGVTKWFDDEADPEKRMNAFYEMMDYSNIFDDVHLYFGIEKTAAEYSIKGRVSQADFIPMDRLSPSNPKDAWYFECAASPHDYTLNFDIDKDSMTWKLWVNHKVMSAERLVGVFCSGRSVQKVYSNMFADFADKKARGYVIDGDGLIFMDSTLAELYAEENKTRMEEAVADAAFTAAVREYLEDVNSDSPAQPRVVELARNPSEYASIMPIGGSDWSVVVLLDGGLLRGGSSVRDIFLLPVALVAVFVLYAGISSNIARRLVFIPLDNLTKSVSKTSDAAGIACCDRDDEIGLLARTIRNMRGTLDASNSEFRQTALELQTQERLLSSINDTATVLLSTSEQGSMDAAIQDAIRIMGESTGIDRIYIWRNRMEDGALHYVCEYEWISELGRRIGHVSRGEKFSYDSFPAWMEALSCGVCLNGVLSDQPRGIQDLLGSYGVRSLLAFPIYFQDRFWGLITFDDCHRDREFPEREAGILRSGTLMIAGILERNEYAARLEAALGEARDANRVKSDFLARMSHEMRTPLNAIIGLSEMARSGSGSGNDESRSSFSNIHSAGMTLLATVNDLLDISKIEANKLELSPVEYDLPALLSDIAAQCAVLLTGKSVEFAVDADENLPSRLYGDDLRVKQILSNLLSNACKFTEKGLVELKITSVLEDGAVWLTCRVRDTGIGIRSGELGSLFTDYARLDAAITRKITGTGLGLSITKRLAELMGGGIAVESEYGKGSAFTVRIRQGFVEAGTIGPDIAASLRNFGYDKSKRRRSSRIVRCRLSYARVLVVDDVELNLKVAEGLLKPYEIRVDCVTGGQEAVDAIRREKVRYDAVFMDHMMPGIDGIEAVRIIREEIGTEYARSIPIIALTANAVAGTDKLFLSKGFQAFLSKPIDVVRLDAVVRQWIRDENRERLFSGRQNDGDGSPESDRRQSERRIGFDRRKKGDRRGAPAGFDMDKGLASFGGDMKLYSHILRSYISSVRPLLEKIRMVDSNGLDGYAITVHGIKGASRGIHADDVGEFAEVLEKAARAGDYSYIETNNRRFVRLSEELTADIENALRSADADSPKPARDKPDAELLARLSLCCEKYDIDGIDEALERLEEFTYESGGGFIPWLRESADRMDYEEIRERISSLVDGEGTGDV